MLALTWNWISSCDSVFDINGIKRLRKRLVIFESLDSFFIRNFMIEHCDIKVYTDAFLCHPRLGKAHTQLLKARISPSH